ncbi:MAG: hypothetical protein F4X40_07070 [Chloroflexi bacterium]|nr:hypothetical protein [Chloroflexota bacterium]
MRFPRDVSGGALGSALRRLGYEKVRQRGLHVRVTAQEGGEHHEVIPLYDPIPAQSFVALENLVPRADVYKGTQTLLNAYQRRCEQTGHFTGCPGSLAND